MRPPRPQVFLRYPEALRPAFPRLKEKLEDPDPGVQSAAVNVICELARKNPKNYLSLAPTFFKLMTSSTNNWMLIKIIKLFGALTPLEPRLGKKLIEPLTNLIHSTSAMSLLYECINTVIAVLISISTGMPNHAASIQLCVQKLRILIEDSDQNLKYLGLLAMSKILKTNPKSVSGHKDLIMGCLDDADESIRLRALDLLSGMVSKKNLMEIVKKLMVHMAKAEGTTYRDELLSKIIQICCQNDYQYISNFEWYVSVLVELSQMEGGGGGHGRILSEQMLDVTIRVQAIRPFATQQMALLVDNGAVILSRSKRQSGADVLYAAGWLVGEFALHLLRPDDTLQSLLRGLGPALPPHIQAVYIQSSIKLFTQHGLPAGLESELVSKLEQLVTSPDLEVQERASTGLQLVRYTQKLREKGELESLELELKSFFEGDLNPVAPKAQRKVPIPEGLDLDAWINEPVVEESSEEEQDSLGGQVFVRDDGESAKTKVAEPTEEEVEASRQVRLQNQTSNPHYLKDSPKASPGRLSQGAVADIPIQEIDLDVPLHIPGLANTDSYFNLSQTNGDTSKKVKKKKKKSKKNVEASSEEEETGPNVFVSQSIDMPEGATLSDGLSDGGEEDDPHKALGNIDLNDILETPKVIEKKGKKKKKNELNLVKSPDLVEHKVHKQKKKKKSKKQTKPAEDDLLGLNFDTPCTEALVDSVAMVLIGESELVRVEVSTESCRITTDCRLECQITLTNLGPSKLTRVQLSPSLSSASPLLLAKSIKPGSSKTRAASLLLEAGAGRVSLGLCLTCEGVPDLPCQLQLPASVWLAGNTHQLDSEGFAELLLGGQLAFLQAAQLPTVDTADFPAVVGRLVAGLQLNLVETQDTAASLYARAADGSRLAFLVKVAGGGGLSVEGRAENKPLLAALLEEANVCLVGET